ncbi:DUF3180 domain-containing protein [Cellulosimicrobium arenosum]|uniref:DUF3180 domain-containing protein n=1 Tax=Cellulosimicrobium arenosum TaxID=2708133 RepID=A0A927G8W8_9MICO|nr:DUF3180 domain-containing protein [Cellulosimicrobium arenosum]MBD8079123.1 DUF3180 domain-containing protein [Cellulosimicrobium arenosum]
MRRTSGWNLLLVVVATATAAWLVVRGLEGRGVHLPQVPWIVDVALLALAGVVLWSGWTVRSYQQGKRPSLDAIRAARTFVLAKAASLTGALLVGWYGAQVLVVLPDLAIEPRRDRAVAAGIAVLCAVVLSVAGLVAERFCQLPPSDGEGGRTRDGARGGEEPGSPEAGTPA